MSVDTQIYLGTYIQIPIPTETGEYTLRGCVNEWCVKSKQLTQYTQPKSYESFCFACGQAIGYKKASKEVEKGYRQSKLRE